MSWLLNQESIRTPFCFYLTVNLNIPAAASGLDCPRESTGADAVGWAGARDGACLPSAQEVASLLLAQERVSPSRGPVLPSLALAQVLELIHMS